MVATMLTLSESPWLFVDGLSVQYTADDLRTLFSRYGTVCACQLKSGRVGGPLRCAYIRMADHMEAERAILQLMSDCRGKELLVIHIDPPF
jgi:hypothetical protein